MLLGVLSALANDDWFYPGEGDIQVSYAEVLRQGSIVGRSGRVIAAGEAATLALLPDVASARALPGGVVILTPKPGVDDLALSRALHGRPDVAWALPDLRVRLQPAVLPDDPLLPYEWHIDNTGQSGIVGVDIDAPEAWAYATGDGQRIAVIDSGVQLDHPDLVVVPGHDYVDGDEDPSPDTSSEAPHGTCAAGVAAATGNDGYGVAGVAFDAEVYAIRLIGGSTSLGDVYDAFTEAVDAGATVLSNSWGYSDSCSPVTDYPTYKTMFKYADESGRGGLGAAVVFAAGNGGCDNSNDGMLGHEELIVVAALESSDTRAGYSNYGEAIDIAAPTGLLTTDLTAGGYGSYGGDEAFVDGFSGTSAATPVVAGVVALMFQANPRLTAAQAREVLCSTATRVDIFEAGYDEAGWSPYYGCGRVDAGAAVAAVASVPPDAPTPVLTRSEVPSGRVVLSWASAFDADGDVHGYEVAWWREGETETDLPTTTVTETSLSLGDAVTAGDRVTWKVRALDTWGDGPWSETITFSVVDEPETTAGDTASPGAPGTGCAQVPSRTGGAGLLATFAALLRRRGPVGRPAAALPGDPGRGASAPQPAYRRTTATPPR